MAAGIRDLLGKHRGSIRRYQRTPLKGVNDWQGLTSANWNGWGISLHATEQTRRFQFAERQRQRPR